MKIAAYIALIISALFWGLAIFQAAHYWDIALLLADFWQGQAGRKALFASAMILLPVAGLAMTLFIAYIFRHHAGRLLGASCFWLIFTVFAGLFYIARWSDAW